MSVQTIDSLCEANKEIKARSKSLESTIQDLQQQVALLTRIVADD